MKHAGVRPRSTHQKWQAGVEISGFPVGLFTRATFPKFRFQEDTFKPAGTVWDHKLPSRISFEDVELEKGLLQTRDLWGDGVDDSILTWMRQCVTIAAIKGGVPEDYLRDVDLIRYDRAGKAIQRFRLYNCYPKAGDFGDMDGSSSEPTIEKITLSYEWFDTLPTTGNETVDTITGFLL